MQSSDLQEFEYESITLNYSDKAPMADPCGTCIWIAGVVEGYDHEITSLDYIFCTDDQLLAINQKHLDHDTYTDIITFDYSDQKGMIESDIYISTDRVADNAQAFGKTFDNELHRVMIHGVLHLLGYHDKTEDEKVEMREKENACLSLREN